MKQSAQAMWYVYIIRSVSHPAQRYIGITDDLDDRLARHNRGGFKYTFKYRPWKLDVITGFPEKKRAIAFECYLKTGSGFAFTKKHF